MLNWKLILLFPLLWMTAGHPGEPVNPESVTAPSCKSYYNSSLKKTVYTEVEVEPEFAGGTAAYARYLNKHMKYPQEMIDNEELQSSVTMTFIVDENGQIINPCITKKDTADYTLFDKEFIKLMKSMPKWKPAICQGKKVTAEVTRPMLICIRWEMEE